MAKILSADFDASYDLRLTGRDIYWLIYVANEELVRLQKQPTFEDVRQRPIQEAFEKLIQIGQG